MIPVCAYTLFVPCGRLVVQPGHSILDHLRSVYQQDAPLFLETGKSLTVPSPDCTLRSTRPRFMQAADFKSLTKTNAHRLLRLRLPTQNERHCTLLRDPWIEFKFNPWHYSSEEPRPTEAVAARWQYRGPCG